MELCYPPILLVFLSSFPDSMDRTGRRATLKVGEATGSLGTGIPPFDTTPMGLGNL